MSLNVTHTHTAHFDIANFQNFQRKEKLVNCIYTSDHLEVSISVKRVKMLL